VVVDGIELICGPGCGKERMEEILRAGWVDLVHPNQHSYSKMTLNLVEKIATANSPPAGQKRKRSESSENVSQSRSTGPVSRGGPGQSSQPQGSKTGHTAYFSTNYQASSRSGSVPTSHQSYALWHPNRVRGSNRGRNELSSRSRGDLRGRGNGRGGHFPRGRGGPWRRW
jgi:hypothetical protein